MKKIRIFFSILLGLGVVFSFLSAGFAQGKAMPEIVPPYQRDTFGQNHYYQVVFDGEGEAAVAAKLSLTNISKKELTSTVVEIPGNNVRMIRAVQEVYQREKKCRDWEQICMEEEEGACVRYEKKCEQWYWYTRTYNPSYYTLEPEREALSDSVKYTFELEKKLGEQERTSLLLYYKVPNQAEKKWGIFNFTFETAKVPYDLDKVRVAVNVQEGFRLKGGEAKTEYKPSFQAMKEAAPGMQGAKSKALSNFSSRIKRARGYVKQTRGLDPWESFTVKGKYAKSWFMLYKKAVAGWVVGILVFLALLVLAIKWWIKRQRQAAKRKVGPKEPSLPPEKEDALLPLKVVGLGFGTGIAILIVLLAGAFILQNMSQWVGYQYSSFFGLFIVLVEGVIVLALFFAPPIYMGVKHGLSVGIWTVVATVCILILLLILAFIFVGMLGRVPGPVRLK